MQPELIKELLQQHVPQADIMVSGDGHHFKLRMISSVFASKNKLERQQFVYEILGEHVRQGDIHAITMQTYTPEEWESRHA